MTTTDSKGTISGEGSSETMDKARTEASHLAESSAEAAKEVADSHFKQGREATSSELDSASDTMSDVASTLEDNDSPFASYAAELSDQLSSFSGKLSTSSIDDLVSGARSLARDNPAAFMLGSVAIGLAASRFFKATAEQLNDGSGRPSSVPSGNQYPGAASRHATDPEQSTVSPPYTPGTNQSAMAGSVGTRETSGARQPANPVDTDTSHLPHPTPGINEQGSERTTSPAGTSNRVTEEKA